MEFSIERLWNGEVCSDTPIHFQLKSKSYYYGTLLQCLKITRVLNIRSSAYIFVKLKIESELNFLVIFKHCAVAKRALYNVSGFCRSCWE